ncbi:hypothetical protein GCK32_021507, partial [Trichostrongylus colubriformis]
KCITTKQMENENETELEHWLINIARLDCKHPSAIDTSRVTSARNWERRENLRRSLKNEHISIQHEEL